MIQTQATIQSKPKSQPYFRITATLLNSWQNIFDSYLYVKESENDEICLEDKVADRREQATQEFIDLLNRKPVPDNEFMKRGREYEADVYANKDEVFSPIVKDGAFQVTIKKKIIVADTPVMLYGVLDCLKAGRIYDIKRVSKYSYGKYKRSHQHPIYLYLVPNAIDFTYLAMDDKGEHHEENYIRENCEDILNTIAQFISWLKSNNLYDVWVNKWAMYD